MKFFSFVRPYLSLLRYKIKTRHIVKKPGEIDPGVKAYIENLEREVFATIQGARRLLLSRRVDPKVITKYLEIMDTDATMVEKIRSENPHTCYDKLGRYATRLRKLSLDLEEKLAENTTP